MRSVCLVILHLVHIATGRLIPDIEGAIFFGHAQPIDQRAVRGSDRDVPASGERAGTPQREGENGERGGENQSSVDLFHKE